ncbi:hypothetical protein [Nocardia sp. NPDC051570]|uniref:hypothetical protein n=1 Tax=Nocardia sp. NPDC051570 TaxID=3364324 RepID=UPI0037B6114E
MFGNTMTVGALLDSSYQPNESAEWIHRIENVRIPVVGNPRKCAHDTTVCRDCADSWAIDYRFTDPLPWNDTTADAAPARGRDVAGGVLRATAWCAAAFAAIYLTGRTRAAR